MEHDEAIELLPAYLDQELGIAEAIGIERHLSVCPECQADLAAQSAASARLKRDGRFFRAPAELAKRIQADVRRSASHPADVAAGRFDRIRPEPGSKPWKWQWMGAGAAAAFALMLAWNGSLYLWLASEPESLTQELVSSHVRSLQLGHLSDVVSTDQHTVKPWFNGKLDFSPPVPDLAPEEFPLEGGRLDYLGGRSVAVLIYRHRKHPINLYVWPSAGADTLPKAQDRQGYHLIGWSSGGMKYCAVSDLAASELADFVTLVRSKV